MTGIGSYLKPEEITPPPPPPSPPIQTSDQGVRFIADYESFRSTPYDDGYGNITDTAIWHITPGAIIEM